MRSCIQIVLYMKAPFVAKYVPINRKPQPSPISGHFLFFTSEGESERTSFTDTKFTYFISPHFPPTNPILFDPAAPSYGPCKVWRPHILRINQSKCEEKEQINYFSMTLHFFSVSIKYKALLNDFCFQKFALAAKIHINFGLSLRWSMILNCDEEEHKNSFQVRFYYCSYGSAISTLQLTVHPLNGEAAKIIWTPPSSSVGDHNYHCEWTKVSVDLPEQVTYSHNFMSVIAAYKTFTVAQKLSFTSRDMYFVILLKKCRKFGQES